MVKRGVSGVPERLMGMRISKEIRSVDDRTHAIADGVNTSKDTQRGTNGA